MGINLGAFLTLVCGYLGQNVNWHLGFASAGFGMVFGVIQYVLGAKNLGEAGVSGAPATPEQSAAWKRQAQLWGGLIALLVIVVGGGGYTGMLPITAEQIAAAAGIFLLFLVFGLFAWLLFSTGWTPHERKLLYVITVLFFAAALFWSIFEQAGSTLNLFADRNTRNEMFGMPFPSSWFQSVNSLFLIFFAPVLAWVWIRMSAKGTEPSSPTKFAWGLVLVGLGFAVLIPPARAGGLASPWWLVLTYFLHTIGELVLSPVGLSDDGAGAGAHRRADDGRVVPGDVRQQFHLGASPDCIMFALRFSASSPPRSCLAYTDGAVADDAQWTTEQAS